MMLFLWLNRFLLHGAEIGSETNLTPSARGKFDEDVVVKNLNRDSSLKIDNFLLQ